MIKFLEKIFSKIINAFSVTDLELLEAKIRQAFLQKKTVNYHLASFLNWQRVAIEWGDYLPPWRPSKDDLKIYEEVVSTLPRNSRILILGATPELRDLAASSGFKPVVVDFSLPMIIEMLQYTQKTNADDEIWIKSDWLSMPLEGNFDVVLGDLVLRMIESGQQEEFLKRIRKILSPTGIFVAREHFVEESLFDLAAIEILNMSCNILDEKLAASAASGRLFDKFSDLNKNIICRGKAIEFMQEAMNMAKNSRQQIIFSAVLKFMSGGIGWAAHSKAYLENLINKFFNINDIKTAADYPDSKFYPIYFLKKK